MKKTFVILKLKIKNAYSSSGLDERLAPLIDRYRSMAEDQKKQFFTGIMFAVVAANIFFILSPSIKGVLETRQNISQLTTDVNVASTDIKNTDASKNILGESKTSLSQVEARVVNEHELPKFLDLLSKMAQDSGIRIEALKPIDVPNLPKEITRRLPPGYRLIAYEMNLRTGYHELGNFLQMLENSETYVEIRNIKIFHEEASRSSHSIRMQIQMVRKG